MEVVAELLTLYSALIGAVVAGIYFSFDLMVLPALRRRPAPDAVRTMQEINRAAVTASFMVFFFGSALLAVAAIVTALIVGGPDTIVRVFGNALIAVGFFSTIALNVPRNNAIAALDPDAPDTPARWARLERGWILGNRLRGATAFAGALGLLLSLLPS